MESVVTGTLETIDENIPDIDMETKIDTEVEKWMSLLLEEDSEEVNVLIEIPKGSRIKYEYDKETQRMICDRVLSTPFSYFFNYGYVPNTLSEDGDPIDAVVLMEESLFPGCSIRCRILGYLETKDEKGIDPKLILCPITKIDSSHDNWRDILDVSVSVLNKIKHFFEHYKDLEDGKFVEVGDFVGKADAIQAVTDSRILYFSRMIDESKIPLQTPEKTEETI